MSEMFASSSEKDANTATATATPPYSSEGPTLPVIGGPEEHTNGDVKAPDAAIPSKKRKAQDQPAGASTAAPAKPPPAAHTLHPSLYTPWTLLPPTLRNLLGTNTRLRATHNIVPVVFSKNQNVKAGINRLKTFLGAYKDPKSSLEMPDALAQDDVLIAVSAQGEGTAKLVGIVDMVRRIVGPQKCEEKDGEEGDMQEWYMYTALSSVSVDWKPKFKDAQENDSKMVGEPQNSQEEEAFEPMDVDKKEEEKVRIRNVPVLTVWMSKVRVPALGSAFGEQSFVVRELVVLEED